VTTTKASITHLLVNSERFFGGGLSPLTCQRRPVGQGWASQYKEKGLKMLEDEHREGRPIRISGEQRAKIVA
jgi:hypothetical protein